METKGRPRKAQEIPRETHSDPACTESLPKYDFNVLMYSFPRDRELKKSYRIDMLALERRKARLERRNRSGFLADSKAAAKNRFRQL